MDSLYPPYPKVSVAVASCGIAAGAEDVLSVLTKRFEGTDVKVGKVGCIGICQREPLAHVQIPGCPRLIFADLDEDSAGVLADALIEGNVPSGLALCKLPEHRKNGASRIAGNGAISRIPDWRELDFFKKQTPVVMRNCGIVDPENIEEYIACGGYFSLHKCLKEMTPDSVIETVVNSGLRGRGGAGFVTGRKWGFARASQGERKYVVCNADEGDPGAYMDRNVLESDPHSVIEGMIIGGYAIGACQGIFYVRHEYPLAVKRIERALNQARKYGLLGKDIFGSAFRFDITIVMGAGAFVCGEETALIASIEDRIGEPRPRPPFPTDNGVRGCPTCINNVETWANIPRIIEKGSDWFAKMGTEESKGTKVFSLVGDINTTGLIEVEMGTTLGEIVYDIGGGPPPGTQIKAVQTGGPSGGAITKDHFDAPVDYGTLTRLGSIMGSGGIVVLGDTTCMVDLVKYFLEFIQDESCGKCVPCREGIPRMLEIVTAITEGKGKEEDLGTLKDLANMVKNSSLCGLGQTAPNLTLCSLRNCREEYEVHIRRHQCPAGVCRALIRLHIDEEKCAGCGRCAKVCPAQAISGEKKQPHTIDQALCIQCGACFEECKFGAVVKE
ncbi:MAG: NADH-quinone oxidoreductase subunit NuoF [Planctomycetes bacterium]|nr:NADH-quinone oxidoreductase subunit NuoF [Planctomycetota bacterium]